MKQKFSLSLGLALLLMILSSPLGAADLTYLSYDAALKKAAATDKIVMIFFWADWCPYCTQIRKEVFELPAVHDVFNKNFVAVSIDVENDPQKLASKYQATALPTLTFVDSKGELLAFWPGSADEAIFYKVLEHVLQTKNDS